MELSIVDFQLRLVQYPDEGTYGVQLLFAPVATEGEAREQLHWVKKQIESDLGWTFEPRYYTSRTQRGYDDGL